MGNHDHKHDGSASRRKLTLVLALTVGYTVAEAVGGWLTGSLALLADAGHMLSDVLSLGLALFAAWMATRQPTAHKTFGYRRAEVLAALANGVTLVVVVLWIFVEAFHRFSAPPAVLGGPMLLVAAGGLAVNVIAAWLLHSHGQDINLSAAYWHVLADLLGSIGAMSAAGVILLTGWELADPVISVVIGVLVLISAWSILRQAVDILLEATPEGINAEQIRQRMLSQEGVADVTDLHVWVVSPGFPALTAHVLLRAGEVARDRRRLLERVLHEEFGIEHTTLQMDHAGEDVPHSCAFNESVRKVDQTTEGSH